MVTRAYGCADEAEDCHQFVCIEPTLTILRAARGINAEHREWAEGALDLDAYHPPFVAL
jgi:hypothetical protein